MVSDMYTNNEEFLQNWYLRRQSTKLKQIMKELNSSLHLTYTFISKFFSVISELSSLRSGLHFLPRKILRLHMMR